MQPTARSWSAFLTHDFRSRKNVINSLEEWVPGVYRFAIRLSGDRHEAEELTQATLLKAWQHRYQLSETAAVKSWIFTICVNLWRTGLRRKKNEERYCEVTDDVGVSSDPQPDTMVILREDVGRARAAMDALPPRQREVLYLHACEGFSLPEIASILSLGPDAVKANLSLARKKMRQQLHDLDQNFCANSKIKS